MRKPVWAHRSWATLKKSLPQDLFSPKAGSVITYDHSYYVFGTAPVGDRGLYRGYAAAENLFRNRQADPGQPAALRGTGVTAAGPAHLHRHAAAAHRASAVRYHLAGYVFVELIVRPVAALAEATQEISRARLDYRVEIHAADELGDLVRSFNRTAKELEGSRYHLESSSRELEEVNVPSNSAVNTWKPSSRVFRLACSSLHAALEKPNQSVVDVSGSPSRIE